MKFIFEMHEQIASYLYNFTSDERDDDEEEEEEEERRYGHHRHEYEDEEVSVNPRDTGCNLNARETFRRRLMNVLCTFILRPVPRRKLPRGDNNVFEVAITILY